MNKVFQIGRLTKNVEINTLTNNNKVARFTIAVNKKYKSSLDENNTDFFNVVAWGKLAEIITQYTKKGDKIAIFGSLQTRTYKNVEDKTVYVVEIIAEDVEFLGIKNED